MASLKEATPSPRRDAFTLIELLVVIAIIAVLAAILFPVFASAKAAAKKTACLSNIRQTNLATIMYSADHQDCYPLSSIRYREDWFSDLCANVPFDWESGYSDELLNINLCHWGNSILPYAKSTDILVSPAQQKLIRPPGCYGGDTEHPVKPPVSASYAMNGLLQELSTSEVNRPSDLIVFSQALGSTAVYGMSYSSPFLVCLVPGQPCRYQPAPDGCSETRNGSFSGMWNYPPLDIKPGRAHAQGSNFAFADGSAKFRRMGANLLGRTNYRVDPFSHYSADGTAKKCWYDGNYCHPLNYRPDFDFGEYGSPVEGY